MLMIRLKRIGRKHDPSYRIVVTEKFRGPKSGKYIEKVGFYDPKKDIREVDGERVKHWMSVGAQVSDTVHNILVSEKVLKDKKKNVLPKKKPIISEKEAEEAAAQSEETPAESSESESAPTESPKEETPTAEEAPASSDEEPASEKEEAA